MKTERLKFTNSQGHELAARVEMPLEGQPVACAVFAHCFTCSKNLLAVTNISRALTQHNIAVLRFDFTGLGESEGDFADTNFSSNTEDLVAAAEFLASRYEAPQILIGHSLGGAAVLMAASVMESVQAVVTIGAPAEPEHVKLQFQNSLEEIEAKGEAQVMLAGREFTIKKQFLDDLEEARMEGIIRNLRKSMLIMHSPQDATVDVSNAAKIYNWAHHPKSFLSLDGADHLLMNKADSLYAGNMIASWVMRYIELPEPVAQEEDTLDSHLQTVARIGEDNYTVEIKAGEHFLLSDEPESVGGKNLGPSPYELLTASLGSCTAMTLRMYANHKGWDLKEVTVHLEHGKKHAADCDDCEASGTKIDHIERYLEVEGNLDEKQRARLLQIADKCPVHKTLESKVHITTKYLEPKG